MTIQELEAARPATGRNHPYRKAILRVYLLAWALKPLRRKTVAAPYPVYFSSAIPRYARKHGLRGVTPGDSG